MSSKTPKCDEDGHCTRCGLEWPDEKETLEPHECPPGFIDPDPVVEFFKTLKTIDPAKVKCASIVIVDTDSAGDERVNKLITGSYGYLQAMMHDMFMLFIRAIKTQEFADDNDHAGRTKH